MVISLWPMLAAVSIPASAEEAPAVVPPPGPTACGAPRALIESGHPQRALVWLNERASGRPVCPGLRAAATAAKRSALERFTYALALAGEAEEDPDLWPAVQALLPEIAAVDADVTRRDESLADLEATVEGGIAQSREFLSQEGVGASSEGWSGLADGYLKDLGVILAAAAGTAILLLTFARLALTVPYRFTNRRRSSKASRRLAEIAGALLLLAASFTVALTLPGAIDARSVSWLPIVLAAALCLGAVVALAYALSTRLRVSIAVAGETEKAGTTEIVALLRELGASAPQGLEVPRGADITALEGKNILTESTGWLAPVIKVVQQIMGFTPWRVVVDHKTDAEGKVAVETFVVVTRNGRSVDAATIRRQPFGPTGPTVDTSKIAAAFVLKAIADGYHRKDFSGLAGAQEWASIGLQYVATTDKSLSHEHRKELLTKAVDLDPSNLLAQVSLKHEQYRRAKAHPELHTYLEWLCGFVGGDPVDPKYRNLVEDHRDLELRVCYTALAVALNHAASVREGLTAGDQCAVDLNEDLKRWARGLLERLGPAAQEPPPDESTEKALEKAWLKAGDRATKKLRSRIQVAAGPMLAQAGVWSWDRVAGQRADSPTAEYNAICAEVADEPKGAHVYRLKRILASVEEVEWAKEDPTLKPLHRLDTWTKEYGVAPRSFLAVPPFKAHADVLTKLGMDTPTTLATSSLSNFGVARAHGLGWSTYRRLRDAAVLVADLKEAELRPQRIEIFAALWGMGLGSRRALQNSALPLRGVVDGILDELKKLPTTTPERNSLETWVGRQRQF